MVSTEAAQRELRPRRWTLKSSDRSIRVLHGRRLLLRRPSACPIARRPRICRPFRGARRLQCADGMALVVPVQRSVEDLAEFLQQEPQRNDDVRADAASDPAPNRRSVRIERRTEGGAQLRFLERDDEPLKVGERQRQQKRRPQLVQQACLSEVGE